MLMTSVCRPRSAVILAALLPTSTKRREEPHSLFIAMPQIWLEAPIFPPYSIVLGDSLSAASRSSSVFHPDSLLTASTVVLSMIGTPMVLKESILISDVPWMYGTNISVPLTISVLPSAGASMHSCMPMTVAPPSTFFTTTLTPVIFCIA